MRNQAEPVLSTMFDAKVLGPLSLITYVAANYSCTMLVRMARTADGAYAFEPTALIFLSLSLRLAIALSMAVLNLGLKEAIEQWRNTANVCVPYVVPAALYLMYDQFYFWVFRWAEPVTWMALSSSLKVVLTAVFVRRVFGTRFDLRTLAPLVAMTFGAFAVEYDPRFTFKHATSFYLIFLAGLSLNCMAAVQQEALFKRAMHTSIHVQNTFVYLFMLISNLVTYVALGAWQRDKALVDADAPLFAGFTWIVLAICVGEAVSGLSMSYVSKVYSSISKVFASSFNMALVSVTSTLLFGTPTTFIHVCGIVMITAALYYYQRDATLHNDAKAGANASLLPTTNQTLGALDGNGRDKDTK